MNTVPSARIRNVALIGHGGSGKTTLAEALLVVAGVLTRAGRTEDGTTVCDFEPEELKRQISVSSSLAPFLFEDCKINLIDTPGYADFIAEAEAGLSVASLAVLVVSAVEGVEVQTEETWRLAAELGIPRLVFVNKLDRERADFERTLDQLRERFGSGIAPLELPIGSEADFKGVADLLSDTAITYAGAKATTGPIPDDMADLEHRVREALVEGIVVADDEMMERYLEGEVPSSKDLAGALAHGVAAASVFPVVCGSAITGVGIDRLASLICEIGPSPLDRGKFKVQAGNDTVEIARDPDGPPLARVFKTIADPFVGSYLAHGGALGDPAPRHDPLRQPHPRRGEAPCPADHARQGDPADLGRARGRHRRGRQALRGPHRRHPGARRTSPWWPRARGCAPRSCRSPCTPRRKATTTSS